MCDIFFMHIVQVNSLADIRRQKLKSRLGTRSPDLDKDQQEDEEEEEFDDSRGVWVKKKKAVSSDNRRLKMQQRLGRQNSPDEGGDHHGEKVPVKSLEDIRRERLQKRLGRNSPSDGGDHGEKIPVKSLDDIRRERLQKRLGRFPTDDKSVEEEKRRSNLSERLGRTLKRKTEEDSATAPGVKSFKVNTAEESRHGRMLKRLGKPLDSSEKDRASESQMEERARKFGRTASLKTGEFCDKHSILKANLSEIPNV